MTQSLNNKKRNLLIILTLIVAVGVSQLICGVLGVLSYEKNRKEILQSGYAFIQKNIVRDIEGSLRFGKDIETFYELRKILSDIMQEHSDLRNIVVYTPSGDVIYSMNSIGVTKEKMSEKAFSDIFGDMHVLSDINKADGSPAGLIDFVLSDESVNENMQRTSIWTGKIILLMLLLSAGVMIVALRFVSGSDRGRLLNKKRVSVTLVVLVVLTQAVMIYMLSSRLVAEYSQSIQENAEFIETSVGSEIEMLMSKGVRISRLTGLDNTMHKIISDTSEISSVTVYSAAGDVIYSSGTGVQFSKDDAKPLHLNNRIEGYIDAEVSQEHISLFAKKLLYDGLTVLVISLMFAAELLIFLFAYSGRGADRIGYSGFMRTAFASYIFGSALAVSFIPLYAGTLQHTSGGLESLAGVLQSLPVSVELFCSIPMVIIAGIWMDRRGWHEPFIIGCCITTAGSFLSGSASDISSFIIARGIIGIGYGLTWTSAISFVVQHSDNKNRSSAVASLVAGMLAGHISGNAVGAMLADSIGFSGVFFVLTFTLFFMKSFFVRPEPVTKQSAGTSLINIRKYLSTRKIISVLLLSVIPYSLCQMGLLLFAVPVYLHSLQVSQSGIGRTMMVYGVTFMCLSPLIGKYADKYDIDRRKLIFAGGIIGGSSLLLIVFMKDALAVAVALFMMGIASSILASSQLVYTYEQPVTDNIGTGMAVSLQRFTDKVGQMMGPIILGLLFSFMKMETGLGAVGVMFLFASLLFWVFTADRGK